MFCDKLKKKKENNKPKIGDKFIIKYSDICVPITFDVTGYNAFIDVMRENPYRLKSGKYRNFETVVEIIGNGKYRDLLTGEIFVSSTYYGNLLDTVTDDYEEVALIQQEQLFTNPLGIDQLTLGLRLLHVGLLSEEDVCRIMKSLKPFARDIKYQLCSMKEEARTYLLKIYEEKNHSAIEAKRAMYDELELKRKEQLKLLKKEFVKKDTDYYFNKK